MVSRLWALFFAAVLIFTAFADAAELCPTGPDPVAQADKSACEIECETYYQQNPGARPASTAGICENWGQWLIRKMSVTDKAETVMACGKGIWDAALNIPEQAKMYWAMADGAGSAFMKNIEEKNEFLRACRQDPSCKREIARDILTYRQRKADGSFVMSDAEVDAKIQGQDVLPLMQSAQESKSALARVCAGELSRIDQRNRGAGLTGDELMHKRYVDLATWDPDCAVVLKMSKPVQRTKSQEPTWLETLGVKWQCYPPAKVKELACFEVAKLVLDPLTLTGGGALAGKALLAAGIRAVAKRQAARAAIATGAQTAEKKTATAAALDHPETARPGVSSPAHDTPASPPPIPRLAKGQKPLPDLSKLEGQKQFIGDYGKKNPVSDESNKAFVEIAKKAKASDNTTFVTFQNSFQKILNKLTDNKALVDAINNRYSESIVSRVRELNKRFPKVKITEGFDWKGVDFALQGDVPPEFMREMNVIFQDANRQALAEMKSLGLKPEGKDPDFWFRAGQAKTADQADQTARMSRGFGENKIYDFEDKAIQQNGRDYVKQVEAFRGDLQSELENTSLLEHTSHGGKMIPKRDVFEIVRKSGNDVATLQKNIGEKLGVKITKDQATSLANYVDMVDQFSPKIYSPERKFASLTSAERGGVSMDFTGLGADNLHQSAVELAGQQNYADAIAAARSGEQKVSAAFVKRMAEKENIARNYLEKQQGIKTRVSCTGDDCVIEASRALDAKNKLELVKRYSKTERPAGLRVSFIGDNVVAAERNTLASHGESIEKALRKELIGKIPDSTLENVTFGVGMQGRNAGEGGIQLFIGNSRTPLTPVDHQKIQEAFRKAVESTNVEARDQLKRESAYFAAPTP